MKKYASNENLFLISKNYEFDKQFSPINRHNYLLNRNQTVYNLDELYQKEMNLKRNEEIIENNNDINTKKNDYFFDYKNIKINNKKKSRQSKLFNPKNIKKEMEFFPSYYKNKLHLKHRKEKVDNDKMTYSLDYKNRKIEYNRKIDDKESNDFYSKGIKKKTYEILNNIPKENFELNKVKNNKKYDQFSENISMRNIQKTSKKLEYEKQFNDYNYEQGKLCDENFATFNPLLNNNQCNENQKLSIDPYKIKNIRCQIQLNDCYHPNKKDNEPNKNNNCLYSYSNNEDMEETNLFSNYNTKTFKTIKTNIEYFGDNDCCNDIRKINSPCSPIEYASTYSTGSDENNKNKKYNNPYSHICQTDTNLYSKKKINNQKTYQLEEPDSCIFCHSICGFHFEPEIKKDLEINKIANFKICGKLKDFYIKIIPDNNKSFAIYSNKKSFINSSIQNNLDKELMDEFLKFKELQISEERELYIKGKTKYKPKNKIIVQDFFKIRKVRKNVKDQGTNMNKNIKPSVSIGERLSIIIDDNLKRRRDLLMQIILKTIIREKNILKNSFVEWYNKAMKISDLEKRMNKKRLKIKKSENFSIIKKISKRDKCVGNEYIPNKIDYHLEIELINNKEKDDKEINTDIPYGFNNDNLQKGKIDNVIFESNKIDLKQLRINEILIKIINSRTIPDDYMILKKYFSIWYRKSKYIPLFDNAKIITEFCRSKLKYISSIKNWKKLYQKFILKSKKANIMKILHKLKVRKYKLYKLIKITRLIQIFNRKKFIRYLILCWFINTNSSLTKKNQMKILYENMLTTYISIADDIFGNNKDNNPSIQHSIMEAVDSNKYQTKHLNEFSFINNLKNMKTEIEKEKKLGFYEKYINNYFSPVKYSKYIRQKEESKINVEKRRILSENKSETKFKTTKRYFTNNISKK